MKVSKVIEALQQLSQDDEILVLWWEKNAFDFPEDYEIKLTDDGWLKVVKDFDEWGNAGSDIDDWIAEATIEHSVPNHQEITKSEYADKMGLTEEAIDNW
jgi:hypothetical protein